MFVQYAPYDLADGTWDERRDEIGANIVDTFAGYAPNLPAAIEHIQILGPREIERTIGITGGNIFHGEILPDQMFGGRPRLAGRSGLRRPWPQLRAPGARRSEGVTAGSALRRCGDACGIRVADDWVSGGCRDISIRKE
jgi:phytoene dehydrogenase-like protein